MHAYDGQPHRHLDRHNRYSRSATRYYRASETYTFCTGLVLLRSRVRRKRCEKGEKGAEKGAKKVPHEFFAQHFSSLADRPLHYPCVCGKRCHTNFSRNTLAHWLRKKVPHEFFAQHFSSLADRPLHYPCVESLLCPEKGATRIFRAAAKKVPHEFFAQHFS